MKNITSKGMAVTPMAQVEQRIFLVRGQAVMLDAHLAELYGVSTGRLNEQVKKETANDSLKISCFSFPKKKLNI